MTDAQLEKAARILCRKIGIDPDGEVPLTYPDNNHGQLIRRYAPAWVNLKQDILHHIMIEEAIQESIKP